jgi:hypothetical protein
MTESQTPKAPRALCHLLSVISNLNTAYPALISVSRGYSEEEGTFPRVTHPSAADPEGPARLACVKPAASVRSEPGSNSQVERRSVLQCATAPRAHRARTRDTTTGIPLLDSRTSAHRPALAGPNVIVCRASVPRNRKTRQTVKLTPPSSTLA